MRSIFRQPTLILVGVWVNRNWILGNWIKEVHVRNKSTTRIHWVASVYAKKHWWEYFVKFPLPKSRSYFFSYPTIFESYLRSNKIKYSQKSIVNYTHNLGELGDLKHQANILNQAHSVHFNCSSDADILVSHGLEKGKVRLVLGAIDEDCKRDLTVLREDKTILLASVFSQRKGLSILPSVIDALPSWKFLILGRGWESFLIENNLYQYKNVEYQYFNKKNRNLFMSRASFFLSLSKLEGGPIPLLESMSMGVIPIVTNTGFAKDVIEDRHNGIILPNPPNLSEILDGIENATKLTASPEASVKGLDWARIAKIIMQDSDEILSLDSQKGF